MLRPTTTFGEFRRGRINSMSVTDALGTAMSVGVPSYNVGDHQGCYDVYRRTAEAIVSRSRMASTDREILSEGMRRAERSS